jgi:replicative DNA helicase
MQKSDLIILAGRPSMGKTALAINIAVNACKILHNEDAQKAENQDQQNLTHQNHHAVAFFSLEMSAEQLSARILSMETSINATKFRNGNISEIEWEVIATRSGEISQLPFLIDDTPALSISAIRNRTRRLVRKHNLSLIVIDYLQLIKGSGRGSENRVQEISEITQGLKAIAKEFNIPVMALSQLSRAVEQRDDKRPQLSDLRESGSIEQDADVVAFIYRESYYHERLKPADNDHKFPEWQQKMQDIRHISEVIIAKQRNGPIDTAKLFFDAEFTRFNNLDTEHF